MQKDIPVKMIRNGDRLDFWDDNYRHLYIDTVREQKTEIPVWIMVMNNEPKRTLAQNALYWKYLKIVGEQMGYIGRTQLMMLHEYFKTKYIRPSQTITINGVVVNLYPTTTELTRKEFSDYIENIRMESGVPIPSIYSYGM